MTTLTEGTPNEPGNLKHRGLRMPELSTQIFIALGAGLAAGLFFGEFMMVVEPVGDIFIGLLQMAVWPYIIVSLVGGLGGLSLDQAKRIGVSAGAFLLLFWGLGLLSVLAFVATFPSWTSAAFFSTSLSEVSGEFDFIGVYIPSNPFASLANSVLPAVVLFSIAMGVALIPVAQDKKQPFLSLLGILTNVFMTIASFIVRLAPIGVFALVGVAAGTMRVEEFVRLQVYIYSYIAVAMMLSLWVLPGLITVLLPISYRTLMGSAKKALITAFATGSLLVALPLVAESIKEALEKMGNRSRDTANTVDVVVPVNFTLPNLGKLIALAFVPFAGWLTGFEMSTDQYPLFLISGLFSMFAEVVALPFLLDLTRIPADTLQLFVALDVSTGRFGQLLAGVHTLALAMLIAGATAGMLAINVGALIRYLVVTVALITIVLGGLRLLYENVLPHEYEQDERFRSMQLAIDSPKSEILNSVPESEKLSGQSRLQNIIERGSIRVGYLDDSLPYAFINSEGELVGMDIDLAHILAREMDVKLEFVPVSADSMPTELSEGRYDLVMSGLAVTPDRMIDIRFSDAYMKSTASFVVRDHLRTKYSSREAVKALASPRIGIVNLPDYYIDTLQTYLPQADIVQLESAMDFFENHETDIDAVFMSAERGSTWSLIYPGFSVAIPQPDVLAAPVSIAMPADAESLAEFVNGWLRLKREDNTLALLYRYWILGVGAEPTQPRWSVVRDVLGWID